MQPKIGKWFVFSVALVKKFGHKNKGFFLEILF